MAYLPLLSIIRPVYIDHNVNIVMLYIHTKNSIDASKGKFCLPASPIASAASLPSENSGIIVAIVAIARPAIINNIVSTL